MGINSNELNKRLKKEIKKEFSSLEKHYRIRDIVIGLVIIASDIIHDSVAARQTWNYEPGFGDRQIILLLIGLVFLGFGLWRKK